MLASSSQLCCGSGQVAAAWVPLWVFLPPHGSCVVWAHLSQFAACTVPQTCPCCSSTAEKSADPSPLSLFTQDDYSQWRETAHCHAIPPCLDLKEYLDISVVFFRRKDLNSVLQICCPLFFFGDGGFEVDHILLQLSYLLLPRPEEKGGILKKASQNPLAALLLSSPGPSLLLPADGGNTTCHFWTACTVALRAESFGFSGITVPVSVWGMEK